MSRQIDLSKSLSDEDRQYLVDRADYESLRQAGALDEAPMDPNLAGGPGLDDSGLRANTGDMGSPLKLQEREDQGPPPPRTAPGSHTETLPTVSNATADPSLGSEPYEHWTNDQLRAEIDKRNEELEDDDEKLSRDGNKADLVATLRSDDENFEPSA